MFLYLSVNLFMDGYWTLGSTFFRYFRLMNSFHYCIYILKFLYSLAVSIKMNILLFAPALLLAYIASQGFYGTIKQLSICAGIQVFSTASAYCRFRQIKDFSVIYFSASFRSPFSFNQSCCLHGWIVRFGTRFLI
jgi:hypothetical protein